MPERECTGLPEYMPGGLNGQGSRPGKLRREGIQVDEDEEKGRTIRDRLYLGQRMVFGLQ